MLPLKDYAQLLQKDTFSDHEISEINAFVNPAVFENNVDVLKILIYEKLSKRLKPCTLPLPSLEDEEVLHKASIMIPMDQLLSMSPAQCQNIAQKATFALPPFCTIRNCAQSILIYNQLNESQREVFERIHNLLSASLAIECVNEVENPTCILLDSEPGTGKSFIVDCLGLTCYRSFDAIVYSRDLTTALGKVSAVNAMTCCKFRMDFFLLEFDPAKELFKNLDAYVDVIQHVYNLVYNKFVGLAWLLIVDEYSFESPIFILTLLIASKVHKFNIIFIGDRNQHASLDSSAHHRASNYDLITYLNGQVVRLNEQVRMVDPDHIRKIEEVRQRILRYQIADTGNVTNNLSHKLFIFELFLQNCFNKDDLIQNVYLAETHVLLKRRFLAILEYAKAHNIPFRTEPYKLIGDNDVLSDFFLEESSKFLPYMLLVVGLHYFWKVRGAPTKIVKLLRIEDDTIFVQQKEGKQEPIALKKVKWTAYFHPCVDLQFSWLSHHHQEGTILHYPLQPGVLTYHNVQGLTLPHVNLVINIDCSSFNSIYIALTRIKLGSQIRCIISRDIISLIYSYYRNDEFLYSLKTVSSDVLNHLMLFIANHTSYRFNDSDLNRRCQLFTNVRSFERSQHAYKKIPRKQFEQNSQNVILPSRLATIGQFFLSNINHISDKNLVAQYEDFIKKNNIKIQPSTDNDSLSNKRKRV